MVKNTKNECERVMDENIAVAPPQLYVGVGESYHHPNQ
jgi:hypothetical protein